VRVELSRILAALFPSSCVSCGASGVAFCAACAPSGRPEFFTAEGVACVALGPYSGTLRRAILALKRGRRDVGERLGRLAAQRVPIDPRAVALVPVPTVRRRVRERGFDQAMLLATGLGAASGLPVLALLRPRTAETQRGRSRAKRLQASGRFELASATVAQGMRVLLVDDVATTGATLRDCAATLERGGVPVIGAIVIARAPSP
jgi:ComF family protein